MNELSSRVRGVSAAGDGSESGSSSDGEEQQQQQQQQQQQPSAAAAAASTPQPQQQQQQYRVSSVAQRASGLVLGVEARDTPVRSAGAGASAAAAAGSARRSGIGASAVGGARSDEVDVDDVDDDDDGDDDGADVMQLMTSPVASGVGGDMRVRKHADEKAESSKWRRHGKHVFVVTLGAKPVYSRFGDEDDLSSLFGILIALMSFVEMRDDKLRFIRSGQHVFVFQTYTPLVLVAVGSKGHTVKELQNSLNFVHSQVISLLTGGIRRMLERRPNYDLRPLLGGTARMFDRLLSATSNNLHFALEALHPCRMRDDARPVIVKTLHANAPPGLVCGFIATQTSLIAAVQSKSYSLHPADIAVTLNVIMSVNSLRGTKSWVPVCLPNLNDSGFVHAFIDWLTDDVVIVLVLNNMDGFYAANNARERIAEDLMKAQLLLPLRDLSRNEGYHVRDCGVPNVRHYVYMATNAKVKQVTWPNFEFPYHERAQQKRLVLLYARLMSSLHRAQPVRFEVTETETVLAWMGVNFKLVVVFRPGTRSGECTQATNKLMRWLRQHGDAILLQDIPTVVQ